MIYIIATLSAMSVALLVAAAGVARSDTTGEVQRRLAELEGRASTDARRESRERRRRSRLDRIGRVLRDVGARTRPRSAEDPAVRRRLAQAGYRSAHAPAIYWGARLVLLAALGTLALPAAAALGASLRTTALAALWAGGIGWLGPMLYTARRRRRRQRELQRVLPDAIDLLVVCVEAGLGLNQALARVAREIGHMSAEMSAELALVNMEIRAGRSRAEALQNLARRTGLADARSLTAMLIQTDRFGTSIGHALRVHSDTLRTKRRQRAEEAAAKTTIKMVFPLVLFIFPALFVVILGPAFIRLFEALGSLT